MIFPRTTPPRVVRNYHFYQPYLRRDFLNRCAYCLRHEAHFGGEANGQIDHFCPESEFRESGEIHLRYTYSNLFWSCAECNNTKGSTWPSAEEIALGFSFIDTSQEDTNQHWQVMLTGEIEATTPAGRFTIDMILLWREGLVQWRRAVIEAEERIKRLKAKLRHPALTPEDKQDFHEQMRREMLFVDPPVFDRPPLNAKQLRQ